MDTILLSRLQFAFTISFHILFPAFSIGLAMFLAVMESAWLMTRKPLYLSICKFWTKIFALTFGMGVVSGLVMEFQLGTNWSNFTKTIGSVLGPLFSYEVMTAFFIEAGFLGVMVFGWLRVSPKLHYISTLLVLVGTTLSAWWIVSANTWMQHPVAFEFKNGMYSITDWSKVVLNLETLPRFIHMMLASYISALCVIASVSAYYLLQKKFEQFGKKCFSFAWVALLILLPIQIIFGDICGLVVREVQPLKTAAMEGLWETTSGAPLVLFAVPDQKRQTNHLAVSIPHLASLINTHQWNGKLQGLKSVPPSLQPNVFPVFFGFRIMVGVGFLILALAITGLVLRLKKTLYKNKWFLRASVCSAPLGFVALWSGWVTTEEGRQPWVVYHLIRTADAASNVSAMNVMISFALIVIVYGIIFGFFYFYFLHKTLQKGPTMPNASDEPIQPFNYMAIKSLENP